MFGVKHDLEMLKNADIEAQLDNPEWKRELLGLDYFFNSLLLTEDQNGWTFDGLSLSQRGRNMLLVVKVHREGTPLVAYTTEQTPTRCVLSFCRQWLEERVKWHPDKFR